MKGIRNSLVLFAASVVMAGTALAQDQSISFDQILQAQSAAGVTWDVKGEPTVTLGPNTRLTGLFVDCFAPQQTWAMLNPSVPSRNLQTPLPTYLLPVTVPRPMSDPAAVHGTDFLLLRLSFP